MNSVKAADRTMHHGKKERLDLRQGLRNWLQFLRRLVCVAGPYFLHGALEFAMNEAQGSLKKILRELERLGT